MKINVYDKIVLLRVLRAFVVKNPVYREGAKHAKKNYVWR